MYPIHQVNLFCFGAGYCVENLISLYSFQNVIATTRTLKQHPIIKFVDFSDENTIISLYEKFKPSHILISIPPNKEDIVFSMYNSLLLKFKHHIKWIGYLSSTGVYGNHEGKLVTEESSLLAQEESNLARIQAEKSWLSIDLPTHIFRLSGIYGPQASPINRLLEGKTQIINKEHHKFSRIYIKDLCAALVNSMINPTPGEIYNLTDNAPASLIEVYQYASLLLNIPIEIIPFEEATISPTMKSFFAHNKLVSNDKIKQKLKWEPEFPTYREGLNDILSLNEELDR
jgi:nucleoside-diphosphate-sugar epimerase